MRGLLRGTLARKMPSEQNVTVVKDLNCIPPLEGLPWPFLCTVYPSPDTAAQITMGPRLGDKHRAGNARTQRCDQKPLYQSTALMIDPQDAAQIIQTAAT